MIFSELYILYVFGGHTMACSYLFMFSGSITMRPYYFNSQRFTSDTALR